MNKEKLLSLIEEKGIKKKAIAKALGISYQAFLNKLYGRTEFSLTEVNKLCVYLGLNSQERNDIFFAVM